MVVVSLQFFPTFPNTKCSTIHPPRCLQHSTSAAPRWTSPGGAAPTPSCAHRRACRGARGPAAARSRPGLGAAAARPPRRRRGPPAPARALAVDRHGSRKVPTAPWRREGTFSPPARWGLLDFMPVACSSPPLLSSSSCSTATLDAQCSLSDLNHDHPRPVFPAGPQPRPSPPSVPCRTSTTTIHAQCSLPDLNREYPRQVFPAGPHVGRYGTKNVQKKVRKNVRQVCYILLANSRVCGRVTGAMPLLTLQVAKFEAISLNRWQSHWGGQRHFHFCTFGAVCKDAWNRQHLTASYYKLLEVISCWIDAWDSQHHTGFLLCITAMVAWWICDIGTFVGAFEPSSTRSRARGRMDIIIEEFSRRRLCDQ